MSLKNGKRLLKVNNKLYSQKIMFFDWLNFAIFFRRKIKKIYIFFKLIYGRKKTLNQILRIYELSIPCFIVLEKFKSYILFTLFLQPELGHFFSMIKLEAFCLIFYSFNLVCVVFCTRTQIFVKKTGHGNLYMLLLISLLQAINQFDPTIFHLFLYHDNIFENHKWIMIINKSCLYFRSHCSLIGVLSDFFVL